MVVRVVPSTTISGVFGWHAAAEVAPAAEVVPAGHETHAPVTSEYVPTAHCAPARATHVKTSNARKSRMQRRPRAFIHFTREMVFFIVLY